MSRRSLRVQLTHGSPGTQRSILVHRYGDPESRPKAYLQAALHADEAPGLLTLHHLIKMLDDADGNGEILGEIVIVPYANPIGLAQFLNRRHSGSGEMSGGGNFNRNWPMLLDGLMSEIGGKLGDKSSANVTIIRASLQAKLESLPIVCEFDSMRKVLLEQSIDADLVLDLHCDTGNALMHLFALEDHWPDLIGLAADLGSRAVLLGESGDASFDECCSTPWLRLRDNFPNRPIPLACVSATVELRGQPDTKDEFAKKDASALYTTLQRRGIIGGEAGSMPKLLCKPTKQIACEVLRAPSTGVLSYCVELGQRVQRGETVAWIIDPSCGDPAQARRPIHAGTEGMVLATNLMKYTMAGWSIGKIVGTETLPDHQVIEGGAFLPT